MSKPVIIRREQAVPIRGTDPIFAHGFGLFETIKLRDGRLCFWSQHWNRLSRSAKVVGLELSCTEEAVLRGIAELVASDELHTCAVKLSLVKMESGSQLYLYARDYAPAPSEVALRFSCAAPLNQHSPLAGFKTHNYMENTLLVQQCRQAGDYDLLRINIGGALAETTSANLFYVVNGSLYTPAEETGILAGVIRSEVLRLARDHEVSCDLGHEPPESLQDAECVFLTNSLQGMVPVATIHGEGFSKSFQSKEHRVFTTLSNALEEAELESQRAL